MGNLYVLLHDEPFGQIELTETLRAYNGRIIECSRVDGRWTMMRERSDRRAPNELKTAQS